MIKNDDKDSLHWLTTEQIIDWLTGYSKVADPSTKLFCEAAAERLRKLQEAWNISTDLHSKMRWLEGKTRPMSGTDNTTLGLGARSLMDDWMMDFFHKFPATSPPSSSDTDAKQ